MPCVDRIDTFKAIADAVKLKGSETDVPVPAKEV